MSKSLAQVPSPRTERYRIDFRADCPSTLDTVALARDGQLLFLFLDLMENARRLFGRRGTEETSLRIGT